MTAHIERAAKHFLRTTSFVQNPLLANVKNSASLANDYLGTSPLLSAFNRLISTSTALCAHLLFLKLVKHRKHYEHLKQTARRHSNDGKTITVVNYLATAQLAREVNNIPLASTAVIVTTAPVFNIGNVMLMLEGDVAITAVGGVTAALDDEST